MRRTLCRLGLHRWQPCGCKGGWQWADTRRCCDACGRHEHLSYKPIPKGEMKP